MSQFPPIVETKLRELNSEDRELFYSEYNRRKKSVLVGYICLLLLGWHYAYVKKWGTQIVCLITLWGLLIWWFIDWFRLPIIIKRYNNDLSVKIMFELSTIFSTRIEKNTITESSNKDNLLEQWLIDNPSKSINDFYSTSKD